MNLQILNNNPEHKKIIDIIIKNLFMNGDGGKWQITKNFAFYQPFVY